MRMELLKYLDAEADKLHEENFSSSDEFRTVNHSFVEGFNYALAIVQGFKIELNENQQVVLELLQKAYAKNKWVTPFGAIYSVVNNHDFAIRSWLTKEQQCPVILTFMEWCMENPNRNEEK